jgi:hypothetical protein
MVSNTRVLEWSCKVTGDHLEGARFLHTALFTDRFVAEYAIDRLYDSLFPCNAAPAPPFLFDILRSSARRFGDGIAVGYAARGPSEKLASEIKVYIATTQVGAVRPIIERLVPSGAAPPANTPRVMIAAALDDQHTCRSRVYYLWDKDKLNEVVCREWLDAWCTPAEVWLMKHSSSRTISVAFKAGQRDMLYLSNPFTQCDINRWLIERLAKHTIAYEQIEHLRWIGLSKQGEALDSSEVNVYFNTVFD